MMRQGLPGRLEPPIRFLFAGELTPDTRLVCARVEEQRAAIATMPGAYAFAHTATERGPTRWLVRTPKPGPGRAITGSWLARTAAVSERWGLCLHLCSNAAPPGTMIELGSSTGISGAYLALGRGCQRLITLEGSPDLARIAQATLDAMAPGALVVQGAFDDGLDRAFAILDKTSQGLTLAFIDGDHGESSTVHYVQRLTPRLEPGALLILDDIYLYADMWRAWLRLSRTPGFPVAINLGRFGILIRGDANERIQSFDLSRYTGWWRVGGSRLAAVTSGPSID